MKKIKIPKRFAKAFQFILVVNFIFTIAVALLFTFTGPVPEPQKKVQPNSTATGKVAHADECLSATTFDQKKQIIEERVKNLQEIQRYQKLIKDRKSAMNLSVYSQDPEDKNPVFYIAVGESLPNNSQTLFNRYTAMCNSQIQNDIDSNTLSGMQRRTYNLYEFDYRMDDSTGNYFNENDSSCLGVSSKEIPDLNEDGRKEIAVGCGSEGTGAYEDIAIFSIQKNGDKVISIGDIVEGGGRGAVLKDMNNDGHLDLVSFLRSQDDHYKDGEKYDSKTCLLQKSAKESDEESFEILSPYVAYYNPKEKSFGSTETLTACIYDPKEMKQFESL